MALAPEKDSGAGRPIHLDAGGKRICSYVPGVNGWKPYVHPIAGPGGQLISLDAPHDHLHHHGMMIGWSDIGGYDFWAEAPQERCGRQIQTDVRTEGRSRLTARIDWTAAGRTLMRERRSLLVEAFADDAILIDWRSEFKAVSAPVALKAHKLGFDGLGVRFARSMDGGGVLNSVGETTFEKASGQPARWCAYTGLVEPGVHAAVAMFSHPDNPRHPEPFFTMQKPFAYLSAAPTFHGPLAVPARSALRLRYALAVFEGGPGAQRIESAYRSWIKKGQSS